MFKVFPVVVGRDYVISNVYIVYLSYDSLVILLFCTIVTLIIRKKIREWQGSVAHVSTLVYPLHWGSTQVDVV